MKHLLSRFRALSPGQYLLAYVLAWILAVLAASLFTSCQASPYQLDGLVRAVQAAASDGQVTPEETRLIVSQLPQPGFDWARAAEIAGSIGASILGVKFIPDRHLRSPFDQNQPQA